MRRLESSVTSVSWIPSEAVRGLPRLPFDMRITHYDDPPPDVIEDLQGLHGAGAFRFANHLSAWVEVDDGTVTRYGHSGRSYISPTHVRLGPLGVVFQPTAFPELRPEPVVEEGSVRFVQTAGGRPGLPAPRTVRHRPFVQLRGPTVWTTLLLVLRADGSSSFELAGASPFPRHWVYDASGRLAAKSGLTEFGDWYHRAFGLHTPWGDEDAPAFVTMAETALERQLADSLMRGGAKPKLRRLGEGQTLVEQGQPGTDVFLLLDGVMSVAVDGDEVAEVGPGAILGERAALEGGVRTATLRAVTPCRVAVAPVDQLDRAALEQVAGGHHRERPEGEVGT